MIHLKNLKNLKIMFYRAQKFNNKRTKRTFTQLNLKLYLMKKYKWLISLLIRKIKNGLGDIIFKQL